ncbi:MAG: GNAT family N-acetyltransferase, partial [Gammaproteobacteria bacterium]|nr:GNAT family N-acetyltransferase [Gammaproteobacteria bacterium]
IRIIESFLDSNFSTVFHEPVFNRVLTEQQHTEFAYNLAYNNLGKLIAVCPQHSIKKGLLTTTFSNPPNLESFYGGWVYDQEQVSLDKLMSGFRLSFFESMTYWSMPQIVDDSYCNMEGIKAWRTPVIDLSVAEDDIWMGVINQKRRNMVRKAEKTGVKIDMVGEECLDEFFSLMEKTYGNAGIALKSRDYYFNILKEYYQQGNGLLLLARVDSEAISGIIVLRNRHICNYWIGASDKGSKNLGQGELLHWQAIKWAKQAGSLYYDLSIVNPEKLPHIAKFKLGLSKNTVPFYLISKRKLGYRIMSRLRG